jgi:hypothetical protein
MDYYTRLSTRDKQTAVISAVVIGGLLLWSSSKQSSLPQLLGMATAVPRTEAQKQGFPADENMPDYQPAVLTNAGQTPSSAQTSNFGK